MGQAAPQVIAAFSSGSRSPNNDVRAHNRSLVMCSVPALLTPLIRISDNKAR